MGAIIDNLNTDICEASILVVDDEAANVRLVEKILIMKGYDNIICTQDPKKVAPLLKEHNCDLIILDLEMPEMDGYQVMKEVSALKEVVFPSILVLTAQHEQESRQHALDSGARDFVTKPFDASELVSRVRNLLDVQMAHKYMLYQNEILEHNVQERTKELERTKEAAEHASLAKTAFLANMSHELRTPLNGIMGFSEMMKDQIYGKLGHDRYLEYIKDIHGAAEHLMDIISDILDITHILSGESNFKASKINLLETIEFCERMVSARAIKADVGITIDIDSDISSVMAEEVRMKQIFLNLLTNSIKYAPGGKVHISAKIKGPDVIIVVKDDGIGISKKHIDVVLMPFGQVRQGSQTSHEGVGLGLYLTHAFTEMHGGTLKIESVVGKGTDVIMSYPVSIFCPQDID